MGNFHQAWLAGLTSCALLAGCQGGRQQFGLAQPIGETAPRLGAAQRAEVHFAFARTLEKSGSIEQAMAAYQKILEKDARQADALARLAVLHARKGQLEQAVSLHKKALAVQPDNADFLCDLGYTYSLQKRWSEAEQQLRKAIHVAPTHARAHNNLGLVLAHTERSREALVAFRLAGCSEADAHANLAFVLTLENSWQEAHEHYSLARQMDPTSGPANEGLRVVTARLKEAEQPPAKAALEPAVAPAPARVAPTKKPRLPLPIIVESAPAQEETMSPDRTPPMVRDRVQLPPPVLPQATPRPAPILVESAPAPLITPTRFVESTPMPTPMIVPNQAPVPAPVITPARRPESAAAPLPIVTPAKAPAPAAPTRATLSPPRFIEITTAPTLRLTESTLGGKSKITEIAPASPWDQAQTTPKATLEAKPIAPAPRKTTEVQTVPNLKMTEFSLGGNSKVTEIGAPAGPTPLPTPNAPEPRWTPIEQFHGVTPVSPAAPGKR